MKEHIISLFDGLSPELATFLLSMLPVTELRASLPLALTVFELPLSEAFLLSFFGNIIPIFLIFWLFPPVYDFAQKHIDVLERVFARKIEKLEKKHKERYHSLGWIFLVILVAIPLPGSGVWTGSLVAIIFNIERKYAIPAIIAGLFLSGLIVAGITLGIEGLS